MRVLITGGAGFIPSNLIRHLLEHTAHEVISLDALTYAASIENLGDVLSHPRLEFVHGDIRDAGLVDEVVGGVDVIVNAAAESHVEKSIRDGASEFVTTNVEGTQILLDAIRACPVERFLLVSSSEVYGTAEASVQRVPSTTPAVWIGCGQNPARTCSASRVRRSGE